MPIPSVVSLYISGTLPIPKATPLPEDNVTVVMGGGGLIFPIFALPVINGVTKSWTECIIHI
jgi:hypothetical protein